MRKEADAKTRSLEALIGAAVGAPVVGVAGALTHQPKEPLEWLDENDQVQSRKRTPEERKERLGRAGKAALIGALVGAGGSLGASAARRGYISHVEKGEAPTLIEPYLVSLRKHIGEMEESKRGGGAFHERELAAAKDALSNEEKAVGDLLEKAKGERSKKLFGGIGSASVRPGEAPLHSPHMRNVYLSTTFQGQLAEHIKELSERAGETPVPMDESKMRGFWKAIRQSIEKKSSVCIHSYADELRAILGE